MCTDFAAQGASIYVRYTLCTQSQRVYYYNRLIRKSCLLCGVQYYAYVRDIEIKSTLL